MVSRIVFSLSACLIYSTVLSIQESFFSKRLFKKSRKAAKHIYWRDQNGLQHCKTLFLLYKIIPNDLDMRNILTCYLEKNSLVFNKIQKQRFYNFSNCLKRGRLYEYNRLSSTEQLHLLYFDRIREDDTERRKSKREGREVAINALLNDGVRDWQGVVNSNHKTKMPGLLFFIRFMPVGNSDSFFVSYSICSVLYYN